MQSGDEDHSTQGHSENYFTEYRNFWWNKDFLDLMAQRLKLNQHHSMLDVGCGQCHWSKLLTPYLGRPASVYAIDNDINWARENPEINNWFEEEGVAFELQQGDAHQLPYKDDSFDLVTCQTVLIHLKYPQLAISEMKRVLKPGGTILCVEPNNMVQNLIKSSLSAEDSIEQVLEHVKYALICERGKKKLGQGDNSLGDLLPGLLTEVGFKNVKSALSDKTIPMYPPYTKREQQAALEQWRRGNTWKSKKGGDLEYFKAFDDQYLDFYERYQAKYAGSGDRFLHSLENEEYHSGGATVMYIVSGVK